MLGEGATQPGHTRRKAWEPQGPGLTSRKMHMSLCHESGCQACRRAFAHRVTAVHKGHEEPTCTPLDPTIRHHHHTQGTIGASHKSPSHTSQDSTASQGSHQRWNPACYQCMLYATRRSHAPYSWVHFSCRERARQPASVVLL